MDGFALARAVRYEADLAALPVILMTRFTHAGEASEAEALGIRERVRKPLRYQHLTCALMCALDLLPRREHAPLEQFVGAMRRHRTEGPARILVAEDHIVNQRVIMRVLDKIGYSAEVVSNGQEALEAVRRRRYDLVLMDCQMPQLDGLEATRRIRREEGSRARIPIVALTANALTGERERCLSAGMDDYLSKPFMPEDLAAIVKRWLAPRDLPADEDGSDIGLPPVRTPADFDPEFYAELVGDLEEELPGLRAALDAAVREGDLDALRASGGILLESATLLGLARVEVVCRRLLEASDSDGAGVVLSSLDVELAKAQEALAAAA